MSNKNIVEILIKALGVDSVQSEFRKIKGPIEEVKESMNGLRRQAAILSAEFVAIDFAVRRAFSMVTNTIKPAYDAVEQFNLSVTRTAAMITSFQTKGDLSENYAKAKEYAEGLVDALRRIDAKTIASAQHLNMITEEMTKQGVLLDYNNEAQVKGFTNIANAVATIAEGSPNKELQVRQEIRAVMQGQVNMNSQLSQQLNAMVGGSLKQKVELWKKEHTLIENIGGLLKGYAAASNDLEGTWAVIGSTMETIKAKILIEGFMPAYKEINDLLSKGNQFLRDHSEILSARISQGWLTVKGLIETVGNLLKPFIEPLSMGAQFIGDISHGLGYIFYVILPPIADRIGTIIQSMVEWVFLVGNLGSALWKLMSLDFSGALADAVKAKEHFIKAGKFAGEAFSDGLIDEMRLRYIEFDKEIVTKKAGKVDVPDLGDTRITDEEKDRVRSVIDARLQVELAGISESKTQRLEAYKTEEAELELKYRQGLMSEKVYQDKKNDLQAKSLAMNIAYLQVEQRSIQDSLEKKNEFFKTEEDRIKEAEKTKEDILKRDGDIAKTKSELDRLGINSSIQNIEYYKKLTAVKRDGELSVLDAEIALRGKINSLKVDRGEITPLEGKINELNYEKELVQAKIQNLETKKQETLVDSEKTAILSEIITLQTQLKGLDAELAQIGKESNGTFLDGFIQGLTKLKSETKSAFQVGVEVAREAANAMSNAFSSFFDYASDKFLKFSELAQSILHDIYMAMVKAMIVNPLVNGFEGWFSSIGKGNAGGAVASSGSIVVHKGGLIPRFHAGGLASDEVPAILQRGEYVISRKGVDALDRLNNGQVGGSTNVIINMENKTGLPLSLKQIGTRVDEKQRVKNIILELTYFDIDFVNSFKGGIAR
ncbi:MAG: hypothetical protein OEV28_08530 [Nitrospirota bacterium]|nr:hypothetical protein [Nitrospirota bacterium]